MQASRDTCLRSGYKRGQQLLDESLAVVQIAKDGTWQTVLGPRHELGEAGLCPTMDIPHGRQLSHSDADVILFMLLPFV